MVIEADLRDPRAILDHPGTRKFIDFGQPLAVLSSMGRGVKSRGRLAGSEEHMRRIRVPVGAQRELASLRLAGLLAAPAADRRSQVLGEVFQRG